MRLASILFACSIAAAQVPLTGILNSTIIDQWANLQNITGDTQYSVMTASNYANGSSAGTTTLNLNDGSGNLTLNGKVLVTANDTSAFGNVNCCNVVIYSLDVLDMSNGANLHTSQVNLMSDYGGAQSTNSPAGWYGKVTSGNVTISTGTWKSAPPFTVPAATPRTGAPLVMLRSAPPPPIRRHARIRRIWMRRTPRLCGRNPRRMTEVRICSATFTALTSAQGTLLHHSGATYTAMPILAIDSVARYFAA